jgi:hypothetical protein
MLRREVGQAAVKLIGAQPAHREPQEHPRERGGLLAARDLAEARQHLAGQTHTHARGGGTRAPGPAPPAGRSTRCGHAARISNLPQCTASGRRLLSACRRYILLRAAASCGRQSRQPSRERELRLGRAGMHERRPLEHGAGVCHHADAPPACEARQRDVERPADCRLAPRGLDGAIDEVNGDARAVASIAAGHGGRIPDGPARHKVNPICISLDT